MSMGGGLAASSSAVRLSRVRIVAVILCCCRVVGVCCPFRPRVPWSRSLCSGVGAASKTNGHSLLARSPSKSNSE